MSTCCNPFCVWMTWAPEPGAATTWACAVWGKPSAHQVPNTTGSTAKRTAVEVDTTDVPACPPV
ncbi:hypothetical protein ACEQUB_p00563 (plasmid) [Ralstonia syzygii]